VKHYDDYRSLAMVVGALQSGGFVRTDVKPDDDGPPWMGRPLFLHGGDVWCDECRELIDPDDWYGEAWPNVLARQKLKYSGTWCGDCFAEVDPGRSAEGTDEPERPGRTFD